MENGDRTTTHENLPLTVSEFAGTMLRWGGNRDPTFLPGIKSESKIARTWERKTLVEFRFE